MSKVAHNAAQARRAYLRKTGRPSLIIGEPFEAVQRKVRSLHSRGMSFRQMDEQLGVPPNTSRNLVARGGALRSNLVRFSRLRFEEPDPTSQVDPTGTVRRIGALTRDGFGSMWLAPELGMDPRNLNRLYRPGTRKFVVYETAEKVAALYDKLECARPEEFGISDYAANRARLYAVRRGSAPRICWDPDTIDDPQAIPEWTGACGKAEGLRIHQREGIPVCPECAKVTNLGPDQSPLSLDPAKLKAAREARKLSITEMGELLGVHRDTVYYWETGRSAPRSRNIIDRYLAVLDLNPEDAV